MPPPCRRSTVSLPGAEARLRAPLGGLLPTALRVPVAPQPRTQQHSACADAVNLQRRRRQGFEYAPQDATDTYRQLPARHAVGWLFAAEVAHENVQGH